MAEPKYPHRDHRGTEGAIDDADPVAPPPDEYKRGAAPPRRRGNTDAGKPHTGADGEKAYGAPMDSPEDRAKKK
jgi:hypothetical protein